MDFSTEVTAIKKIFGGFAIKMTANMNIKNKA